VTEFNYDSTKPDLEIKALINYFDNKFGRGWDYGYTFPVALAYDNLVATQFHPEKSQTNGLRIIENFCNWDGKW
jgi:imidazoleglycerol phosphate synthase glutamine amidotransferase subunit HisH